MSPLRARKGIGGKWFRINFTLRSVSDWLRDFMPDGHVDPGRRPWSSITIGRRGLSYNTKRRTGRVDLPGPFSYETPRLGEVARSARIMDELEGQPIRWGVGAVRDEQHCGHWYDHSDWPCCRCGYNGPDETACPGEPRDGRPPVTSWTDSDGRRWEQTQRPDGGTSTRYLPDPVSADLAEQQECPRCGAEPGSPCRTHGTGRPTNPHMPRVELARLERAYPHPDRQFSCEHGVPADTRCELCDTIPPWGTPPH